MSAIDFPNDPSINDEFTVNEVTYVWDGVRWSAKIDFAAAEFFTATVIGSNSTSDWSQASSSDPFIATLTVNGILSTDRPIVDIDLSGVAFSNVGDVQNGWRDVYRVEASDNNEIKLYALTEPEVSFELLIKVVR